MKRIIFILGLLGLSNALYSQILLLKKPVGGEVWAGYSIQRIEWTSDNIDNVKIESSLDSGRTWTTLVNSYPASAQYYDWEIPNKVSDSCFIRISDISNSSTSTSNYKNKPFRIPPISLSVDSLPSVIMAGSVIPLTWNSSGVRKLNIYVSNNNKTNFLKIADSISAVNLYYNWIVPDSLAGTIYIKMENAEDTALNNTVSTPAQLVSIPNSMIAKYKGGYKDGFSSGNNIERTVQLTSPKTIDSVYGSQKYMISWSGNNIENISLQFSSDNGITWSEIISNYPFTALQYDWVAPNLPTRSGRIKIVDSNDSLVKDITAFNFIIRNKILSIAYPDSSAKLQSGTSLPVSWISGGVNLIKLAFQSNNKISLVKDSLVTGNEMFNWVVPDSLEGKNIRMVLTDLSDSTTTDTSVNFVITKLPTGNTDKFKGGVFDGYSAHSNAKSVIQIISPTSSDEMAVSSSVVVKWQSSNVEMINIKFSSDSGKSWSLVTDNFPASAGSFIWKTPNTPSSNCFLKIMSVSDSLVYDKSQTVFTLLPKRLLNTTDSLNWVKGTSKSIEWSSLGIDSINIYYKLSNSSSWIMLKDSVTAIAEVYNWILPEFASDTVWLKLVDLSDTMVSNEKYFTGRFTTLIKSFASVKYHGGSFDGSAQRSNIAKIIVQRPVENEVLKSGTIYTIKWSSINLEDSILLQYSVDSGATWKTIVKTSANAGLYEWHIPEVLSFKGFSTLVVKTNGANGPYQTNSTSSNKCLIRALDPTSENTLVGISSKPFTITSSETVPKADLTFNVIGDNTFTAGLFIKLYASSQTGILPHYFLKQGSGTVSNDTFFVKEAGPVTIGAYALAANGYANSDTILRTFCINPTKPIIQLSKNTVVCVGDSIKLSSSSVINQWYKDDVNILGANDSLLIIKTSGNFTDTINIFGCRTGSDVVNIKFNTNCIGTIPKADIIFNVIDDHIYDAGLKFKLYASSQTGIPVHYYVKQGAGIILNDTLYVKEAGPISIGAFVLADKGFANSDTIFVSFCINPPKPFINYKDSVICSGDSIILSSNSISNQWYKDGVSFASNIDSILKVKESGIYTDTVRINGCQTGSDKIKIQVVPLPATPVITSSGGLVTKCDNDSIRLFSNALIGNKWYINGTIIASDTGNVFIPRASGKYSAISVFGSCKSDISNVVAMTVNPRPVRPKVEPLILCEKNDTLSLRAENERGYFLTWYSDSLSFAGVFKNPIISLQTPRNFNYYVSQTSLKTGCESDKAIMPISIGYVPPVPIITRTNDNLISTIAKEYKWYINNTLLPSANTNILAIPAKGIYKVEIREDSSCWVPSSNYLVQEDPNSIASDSLQISVYPNPTQNIFFTEIKVGRRISGFVTLHIVDNTGYTLKTIRRFVFNEKEIKMPVYISLKKGVNNIQVFINGYLQKTIQIIGL